MTKKIIVALATFGLVTLVGMLLPMPVQAGIGVSPASIENNKLRPGTRYVKELVFSQSTPDEALVVQLEPDFEGYNDWFSFEPSNAFTIEPGVQRTTVKVIIDVPETAKLLPTTGAVRITASKAAGSEGAVEVVKGAKIDVSLATTNAQFVEFLVRAINMGDVDSQGVGTASVKIENVGNVAAAPTKMVLEILDLSEQLQKNLTIAGFEKIEPGQVSNQQLNFTVSGLEAGDYFADASVYYQDKILRRERLVITVQEQDTAKEQNQVVTNNISDNNLVMLLEDNKTMSLLLVVLIATAFTALLIFLFRNSEEREQQRKKANNKQKTASKKPKEEDKNDKQN